MRLQASFRSAILACAVAYNLPVTEVARAQQFGGQAFGDRPFAGQQFSGQYPNIAPAQSSGPGYYAAAMQSAAPTQPTNLGPMAPPPMARSYPGAPPQSQFAPQPTAPAPYYTSQQAPKPAPAKGPFAGLKSSLGRFSNPPGPQIPAPQMSASPQYRAPAAPPFAAAPMYPARQPVAAPQPPMRGPGASAPYPNQTAGYATSSSPYAEYAAQVAARASQVPNAVTPAAFSVAANAAARPNVALQTRGPGYGASYLQANQPMAAPAFSTAPAPNGAPGYSAPQYAAPQYSAPQYGAPGMASPPASAPLGGGMTGGGFVGPSYDAPPQANPPSNYPPANYGSGNYGPPGGGGSSIWQQPAVPDPISSGGYGGGAPFADPSMAGSSCDPGEYFDPGVPSCGPWFASISGLIMTRDVPNNVGLAYVGADPHQPSILNTETAGFDWSGGAEAKFGRMIGDRWALELVYWWLDPSNGYLSARSDNNDINSRLDMSQVLYEGTPLSDIFENSHEQRVYRSNQFQNIEINLLQQALVVDPANRFGMAYFTGARYFKYREILEYYAVQAGAEFSDNDFATQSAYHIRMRNSLIGWQVGARGHMYLGERLRLYATPRFGLFANAISQQEDLCMVINLRSSKTDVAVLGQIDLGASLQVFRCCSIFAGYRAMGIAGVANADDQVARTFDSLADMSQINSSGSIILHGVNTGVQFQF